MVARHLGDHGEQGFRDVRRVESTTQADLEHGGVHAVMGEVQPGRRGQALEVGRRRVAGGLQHPPEPLPEFGFRDRHAVDSQPLLDVLEVG